MLAVAVYLRERLSVRSPTPKLTYMSIHDLIIDNVRRKTLNPLMPRAPGVVARRAMFLSEDLNGLLHSPQGSPAWEERLGFLRADLEVFVTGEPIHPKYLFLLYKAADGIWEIRSVGNEPSIRVLGLFVEKDVFVATNFALRESLGGWQSREWKVVKRAAKAKWRALFHSYLPLITTDVNDCVSGAIDGRYFKSS